MALSDDIKAAAILPDLIGETATLDRAKSTPAQGKHFYRCPLHADGSASLYVTQRPGKLGTWYCFGCHKGGTAIDWIMERDGVSFPAAVSYLAGVLGIAGVRPSAEAAERAAAKRKALEAEAEAAQARRDQQDRATALDIWRRAIAPTGLLCDYLAVRTGRSDPVPPTLRLHPGLTCYEGEDDKGLPLVYYRGPAMVAAVGRAGETIAGIHRTWIEPTGRAKVGDRKVPKQMKGRCYGLPVVLSKPDPESVLLVGEGIETTLAVLRSWWADPVATVEALGLPQHFDHSPVTAEAALSLGALAGPAGGDSPGKCAKSGRDLPSPLPDLETTRPGWLPPSGHSGPVVILADPSAKSPAAALNMAARAKRKLTERGLTVLIAFPNNDPAETRDFADLCAEGVFL